MRAQIEYPGTTTTRTGNWSTSETLPILTVPPPARIHAIRVRLLGGIFSNQHRYLLSVLVKWFPSNLRKISQSLQHKINVTGYRVAVGLEPVEGPFGEVPMNSKISNFRVRTFIGSESA